MKLRNPTVLITGASGRLGFALARQSLAMGMDVVIHYRSSDNPARQWLEKHPALARRTVLLRQDLENDPAGLVDRCAALASRLVGLVNNASQFTRGNLHDPGHLLRTLTVNALTPALLSEQFFRQVRRGWIVNITDAHIRPFNANYQNYRLSKLLLEELTRQSASLYAPHVRVNAIAPGAILPAKGTTRAGFRAPGLQAPLEKNPRVESFLTAYRFFVENTDVTGQTVFVDGGRHLQ